MLDYYIVLVLGTLLVIYVLWPRVHMSKFESFVYFTAAAFKDSAFTKEQLMVIMYRCKTEDVEEALASLVKKGYLIKYKQQYRIK